MVFVPKEDNGNRRYIPLEFASMSEREIRDALIRQLSACGLTQARIAGVFSRSLSRSGVQAILGRPLKNAD